MALLEYKPGTTFPGRMGRTIGESEPAWPAPRRAKEGAANVMFIVLDGTGFGQLGCYGSPIRTPNLDKLAKNGLLYNNMHTTAPSRHRRGHTHPALRLGGQFEYSSALPGARRRLPKPRRRGGLPRGGRSHSGRA
jgi:arylsulfatase